MVSVQGGQRHAGSDHRRQFACVGSSIVRHARAQAEHERVQSALFDARQAREEADSRAAPSAADLAAEERDALALRVRCHIWRTMCLSCCGGDPCLLSVLHAYLRCMHVTLQSCCTWVQWLLSSIGASAAYVDEDQQGGKVICRPLAACCCGNWRIHRAGRWRRRGNACSSA